MVDVAPIIDPPLPTSLPPRLRADGTPISTPTPGDTFTRAPLDPADPANAELIAAQGELGALLGACASGSGNGAPLANLTKWVNIVGRCAGLVARIQSSITSAITDRIKAIGKDILAKVTNIEGLAKTFVPHWESEIKSIYEATKLILGISKVT